MRKRMSILLIAVLVFSLAACGGEKKTEADAETVYTVHVEDENGAPMSGVMVQLCKDVCMIGATDTEGNAVFSTAADDYKVSILSLPEGYGHTTEETEFSFEPDSFEMTLVLRKTA